MTCINNIQSYVADTASYIKTTADSQISAIFSQKKGALSDHTVRNIGILLAGGVCLYATYKVGGVALAVAWKVTCIVASFIFKCVVVGVCVGTGIAIIGGAALGLYCLSRLLKR